jgi:hypothetical protein
MRSLRRGVGLLAASTALAATLALSSGTAGPAPAHGRPRPAAQEATPLGRIVSLLKADLYPEAGRLADETLARGPVDPKTEAMCGLAILKSGRVVEADAVLKRANSRGLGIPEAALGLGRIARIRNEPERALPLLRGGLASADFYEEACRYLWRTAGEIGFLEGLRNAANLITARFEREGRPAPDWFVNNLLQIRGASNPRFYAMGRVPDRVTVPLHRAPGSRIRMVSLRLNGQKEYPFDIDSASADFLTISPLLAEELGLEPEGSSKAIGVGTGHAEVRFARLDKAELGGIVFEQVPVMVSDLHVFRGQRKGLLGTALLKRFNVTIDVRSETMVLYDLNKPELLAASINKAAVAADLPLYLFEATMVRASLAGAPEGLYILDSAAATNLVDNRFFGEHIKPRLDPARIVVAGIRGAQGVQQVNLVEGLEVRLGNLAFSDQQAHEFPMAALNVIGGRYAAGLLGNPVLWPYRVHMDFRRGRLVLERFAP